LRCAERARSLGDDLAAFDIQIVASTYLGWVHHIMGEYRQAANLFRGSASRLRGDLMRERFGQAAAPGVYARSRLAWSLAELGEFGDALGPGEEGLAVAEAGGQPFNIVVASIALGSVHLLQGNHTRAITILERALELCRTFNIPSWLPPVASSLGRAYFLTG